MKVVSNKTLVYWKEAQVAMRQQVNELRKALKYAKRKVRYCEGKMLVCVVLSVLVGGCQLVRGGLEDISWTTKTLAENINTDE